jgi:HEAT repeat protein
MTPDQLNALLDSLVRHANHMRGLDPSLEVEIGDLLQHPDPAVVSAAATTLGVIASRSQLPRLLAMLSHPSDGHRAAAAAALAGYSRFDDERVSLRFALAPLLDDDVDAVRLMALQSLGSLGIDGAEDRIVRLLGHPLAPFRRLSAALAGRHRLRDAIPALQRLLAAPEEEVRAAACAALIALGVADVLGDLERLLDSPSPVTRIAILQAIQFGRARWAADHLVARLRDPNPTVRDHALQGVRVLRVREALPVLRALLANRELFRAADLERAIEAVENA